MWKNAFIAAALALALGACATPSAPRTSAPALAAGTPPVGCVGQTASLVPVSPTTCAGFGRTYTQQDLRRTGTTDVGQALRRLDPSINSR